MKFWPLLVLSGMALAGGGSPEGVTLLNGSSHMVEVAACAATRCTGWQPLKPGESWRVPLAPVRGSLVLTVSQRPGGATDFVLTDVRLPLHLVWGRQGRLHGMEP